MALELPFLEISNSKDTYMKFIKHLILAALALFASLTVSACSLQFIYSNNTPSSSAPSICTVSFDTQGGTSVDAIQIEVGDSIPEAPVSTREGFELLGWETPDETLVAFPFVAEGDITLSAIWQLDD